VGDTRYVQVGLGVRSWMFSIALAHTWRSSGELVGLCDRNAGRLAHRAEWARAAGLSPETCTPEGFEALLAETRADVAIVTTDDRDHDRYICAALDAGCDVVTEKPLTIDAERLQRILDAIARSGRRCRVTFNYRYAPPRAQVKELLDSGTIGEVTSVDFEWLLDTWHGADYFRRWHRRRESSGGLLVHKATHHFDLVNWWLATVPERVFATGSRRHYTPARAAELGLERPAERCLDCQETARCPFHLDLRARKELAAIYLEHEHHDGYWRDRCVFSPEIDIEDSAGVLVEYQSGARLTYSLEACMPYEGYRVAFNGTHGRLEHTCREASYMSGDGGTPGELLGDSTSTRIFPHFGEPREVAIAEGEGGHGGGDALLLADLFADSPPPDPLGRAADHRAGAWSILTGIAANRSIASGAPVRISDLVQGLELPERA
jgi:predicted dehydrogenase